MGSLQRKGLTLPCQVKQLASEHKPYPRRSFISLAFREVIRTVIRHTKVFSSTNHTIEYTRCREVEKITIINIIKI